MMETNRLALFVQQRYGDRLSEPHLYMHITPNRFGELPIPHVGESVALPNCSDELLNLYRVMNVGYYANAVRDAAAQAASLDMHFNGTIAFVEPQATKAARQFQYPDHWGVTIERLVADPDDQRVITTLVPNKEGQLPIPRIDETICVGRSQGDSWFKVRDVIYVVGRTSTAGRTEESICSVVAYVKPSRRVL